MASLVAPIQKAQQLKDMDRLQPLELVINGSSTPNSAQIGLRGYLAHICYATPTFASLRTGKCSQPTLTTIRRKNFLQHMKHMDRLLENPGKKQAKNIKF